jgi:hypothetical protein
MVKASILRDRRFHDSMPRLDFCCRLLAVGLQEIGGVNAE